MKQESRTTLGREARNVSDQKGEKKKPESAYRRLRYELSKTWARAPLLRLRHRGFRSADIFFGSYPRSGSTWLRFTIFEMLTGQEATFEAVNEAFRGLGSHSKPSPLLPGGGRLLVKHEVYRRAYNMAMSFVSNGQQMMVSEYAYLRALGPCNGELNEFVNTF